jgi:DNA-directed RNA polymerase specialized sigma24 family protein
MRRALDPADDAALTQALVDGDPLAPAVIRRRFAPTVSRILRLTLGRGPEIDALVDQVFSSLAKRAATSRKGATLEELVISATIAVCSREGRRRRATLMARAVRLPAPDPDVARECNGRELVLTFRSLLMGVRPVDRVGVVLRLIQTLEGDLDIQPDWGLLASGLVRGTA